MTEYRDRIAREFSTFRFAALRTDGVPYPELTPDPRLRRRMLHFVDAVDDTSIHHDTWARYFLLGLYARDLDYLPELRPDEPNECQLIFLIQHWTWQAKEPNLPMQTIHTVLLEKRSEKDFLIADFFYRLEEQTRELLVAYLQTSYWFAAQKLSVKRRSDQREDYYRIGLELVSDPAKLLRKFDFSRDIKLRTYAEATLKGVIRDELKASSVWERTNTLGDYGLLRSLSKKELRESLSAAKYSEEKVVAYLLIFQSFEEIYQATHEKQKKLRDPSNEEIKDIGKRYQQLWVDNISETPPKLNIESVLQAIAATVRAYRDPKTLQKRIVDKVENAETPLDIMETLDSSAQMAALATNLRAAIDDSFNRCKPAIQTTLKLSLGLDLNQSDIVVLLGQELGVKKQFQLSRKLQKYQKDVLRPTLQDLLTQHPELLQSATNFDGILLQAFEPAKEYLQTLCQSFFYAPLIEQYQRFSVREQKVLRLIYGLDFNTNEVAEQLSMTEEQVEGDRQRLEQQLQTALKTWTEQELNLSLSNCKSAPKKLDAFVKHWLNDQVINYINEEAISC